MTNRTIFETLYIGWDLLSFFPNPTRQLKRIDTEQIEKYPPGTEILDIILLMLVCHRPNLKVVIDFDHRFFRSNQS